MAVPREAVGAGPQRAERRDMHAQARDGETFERFRDLMRHSGAASPDYRTPAAPGFEWDPPEGLVP